MEASRGAIAEAERVEAVRSPLAVWRGDIPGEKAFAPTRVGRWKRLLDMGFSVLGIVATAPAWLAIPLAIKLEDRGPVFFAQERVGRDGRRFRSLKFRSMRERNGDGPCQRAELEEHRVTRVGRVLRATALDELPQLLNILRGDMSLVGPRALLPEEVVDERRGPPVRLEEVPGFRLRHSVRPGLTGLAQVRAPRDVSHRHKFRYDLFYVRRRNLWLDVRLVFLSVWISLRGKWPEIGRTNGKEGS